mgnify:CR=1 FL=1
MRKYNRHSAFVIKAEKLAVKKSDVITEQISLYNVLREMNINDEAIIKLILDLYSNDAEFLDVIGELREVYKTSDKSLSQKVKRIKWLKAYKDTYIFDLEKIKL